LEVVNKKNTQPLKHTAETEHSEELMRKQGVLLDILDIETQFIWTASGDGMIGKSAHLWCAYTGQREEDMQGWGWIAALHPDDRQRARQLWQQAIEQKRFYETWYRIYKPKEGYHAFLIRCMPILQEDGTLKEWVSQFVPATAERLLLEPDSLSINLMQHSFFEQAAIGVVYVSLDGRYLHVNECFCTLTGYLREELLGRKASDITFPEDDEISRAYHPQQLAGSLPSYVFEKRYIRKDGATIWTRVTSIVLRLPSGDPLCFFGLVEDITEHKRSEEAQKQLLEFEHARSDIERQEKLEVVALTDQLKAIFEAMTDGIIFCDVTGKILLQNTAGSRLMESGEIDLTGEHHLILLPLYEVYDKDRQPLSLEQMPLSRILRGEILLNEHTEEVIVHLPSGREAILGISGAPVYDQQGQMIGGVCVFRDITESRKKEQHAQQALNTLLTIMEKVSQLPIQSDPTTDIVPARSLYTIGQSLTEIIHQVLQRHFVACILKKPQTGQLCVAGVSGLTAEEEKIFRKEVEQPTTPDYLATEISGSRQHEVVIRDLVTQPYDKTRSDFGIRYRLIAPMLLDEQCIGALIIGQSGADVVYTSEEIALVKAIARLVVQVIERVRLTNEWLAARTNELALREANRRFDAFLSIASHELRTPLTTIRGNIQLALRRIEKLKAQSAQHPEQPATSDSYEQVIQGLERVYDPLLHAMQRTSVQDRMISDLLDASRIRANKLELEMQAHDLSKILREVVEDLRHLASDRQVLLHLPEVQPVHIVADADRIGQVINNYLTNALRYSAAEHPVEISLDIIEGGKMARVAVRDQGPGIAPEDLEHIWERFYRSHNAEKHYDTGAGLGLGLYISRTIIERHHGQVGVASTQGKGSMFWFTLPLQQPEQTC
jgi:PAS domain S-box-containing protein